MALVVIDNAWETTTSTGPTTFTLAGAVSGSQSMAGVGNTNTSYFRISDQLGTNWTVVLATYSITGPTLTVLSTYASSNSNNAVTFGAGTKNVWCVGPAESTVLAAPYAYPTVSPTLNLDFANSATVDPRITFVRNSTATYYDGKTTAMAEQNLLLYSNTFSNAVWVATNGTVASGVTDPAGTTTAFSFTATGAPATLYQTLTTTATPYTLSFYIQRVTGTGAVNLTLDGTTLTAQTITGSWARYSVTATPTAASHTIGIQLAVSGDAVNIFTSQLENRSSMTAANITTTSPITNYIPVLMTAPAGVPRLDYNPTTGQALGLLIEESRTNLLTYSGDFSNAAWGKTGVTIGSNSIAPDGSSSANQLVETAVTNNHLVALPTTLLLNNAYVLSVYVKKGTLSTAPNSIQLYTNFSSQAFANFDISTGALGTVGSAATASITSVGNGWYRCLIRVTVTSVSACNGFILFNNNNLSASAAPSYLGAVTSDVYIWGAQIEVGSFATSYIPTTSAAVTRTADQASMTGTNFSSWYNIAQGTFFTEGAGTQSNAGATMTVMNSTYTNYAISMFYSSAYYVLSYPSGNSMTFTASSGINTKQSFAYTSTNIVGSLNGSVTQSIANASNPALATLLTIGNYFNFSIFYNGRIKKLAYYPQALTSAQLQSLTGS